MERRQKEKVEGSAPESHDVELWNASRIEHSIVNSFNSLFGTFLEAN
jgi:hypothetical protein